MMTYQQLYSKAVQTMLGSGGKKEMIFFELGGNENQRVQLMTCVFQRLLWIGMRSAGKNSALEISCCHEVLALSNLYLS
jgi:hypothetical protein